MEKILIVDDNDHLVAFLEKKFREAGHEVVTAFSGISAVKALVDYTPGIIFCDYFLPNFNGDKLCQMIRKMDHLSDAYVVIMTAAASELNLTPSEIGADALMAKGSFEETQMHCLSLIEEAAARIRVRSEQAVIGIDSVYPRQMTKELLQKNLHLQTILDSISEGVLELSSGQIAYANPMAEKILGIPLDRLLAVSFADLFQDRARGQIEALLLAGPGDILTLDRLGLKELSDKILSIKKLSFNGNDDASLLMVMDITEKTLTDKSLRDYQGRLETLVQELRKSNENLMAAYQWMRDNRDLLKKRSYAEEIVFLADRDGKIEWLTEATQECTGLSRFQLLGGNVLDLFTQDCRERVRESIRQAWHGIVGFVTVEVVTGKNGQETFELKVTRITAENVRRLLVLLQRPVPRIGPSIDD